MVTKIKVSSVNQYEVKGVQNGVVIRLSRSMFWASAQGVKVDNPHQLKQVFGFELDPIWEEMLK